MCAVGKFAELRNGKSTGGPAPIRQIRLIRGLSAGRGAHDLYGTVCVGHHVRRDAAQQKALE